MKVATGALGSLLLRSAWAATVELVDTLYNGTVTAEQVSVEGNLDGPKVTPRANDTAYDWWYFDVVSASSDASVNIVFYDGGPHGFINSYHAGPFTVSLSGSFSNGTLFSLDSPAAGGAVIATEDDSFYGEWKGSGFTIRGTGPSAAQVKYVITVDAPGIGVKGTVSLVARAPAHYPCGLNIPGVSEMMVPHVWWSNAVPDADATVDLAIGGSRLAFDDGVGYHDKNWGDKPFVDAVTSWYWGHAAVGPYSIVWFDALDGEGAEHASGYVAVGGEVLLAGCEPGAVTVRPWGANGTYPPVASIGEPQGLEVRFRLDHGQTFVANVTSGLAVVEFSAYIRALGTVTGSLEGPGGCKVAFAGRALWEEFKFTG